MKLEEAKELFEEIVESIYELDNPQMQACTESIYSEASNAKSLSRLMMTMDELIVLLTDVDMTEDEEDAFKDIQEKIELMGQD